MTPVARISAVMFSQGLDSWAWSADYERPNPQLFQTAHGATCKARNDWGCRLLYGSSEPLNWLTGVSTLA